jgi:hypothetical protein
MPRCCPYCRPPMPNGADWRRASSPSTSCYVHQPLRGIGDYFSDGALNRSTTGRSGVISHHGRKILGRPACCSHSGRTRSGRTDIAPVHRAGRDIGALQSLQRAPASPIPRSALSLDGHRNDGPGHRTRPDWHPTKRRPWRTHPRVSARCLSWADGVLGTHRMQEPK